MLNRAITTTRNLKAATHKNWPGVAHVEKKSSWQHYQALRWTWQRQEGETKNIDRIDVETEMSTPGFTYAVVRIWRQQHRTEMDAHKWSKTLLHSSQYSNCSHACSDSMKEVHIVRRQYFKIIAAFRVQYTSHAVFSADASIQCISSVRLSVHINNSRLEYLDW